MAEEKNNSKDKVELVFDPKAPVTAEELREHKMVEHLLHTSPQLQEKSTLTTAITEGAKKFHFGWKDWASSAAFGLIFGVTFGYAGSFAVVPLKEAGYAAASSFVEGLCGTFGLMLGAKSAVAHPLSEMTKTFYDKCKEGYAEAKQHNKAVEYLRDRVQTIKAFARKSYMKDLITHPEQAVPMPSYQAVKAEEEAAQANRPESRVAKAIIAERQKLIAEATAPWAQRTEAAKAAPSTQTL